MGYLNFKRGLMYMSGLMISLIVMWSLIYMSIIHIFNLKYQLLIHLTIIFAIAIITMITYVSIFINHDKLYVITYNIMSILLGYLMTIMISLSFYGILSLFFKMNYTSQCLLLIFFPLFLTVYGLVHAQILYVKENNLTFTKYDKHKKICHLSDVHLGGTYRKWFVEKLVNKIISINPDVVVITGDFFDGSDKVKLDWLLPFNKLTMPILYITGNHESLYGVDHALNLINKTNIKHIGDKSVNIDGCIFHGFDFKKNQKLLPILKEYKNNDNEVNIVLNHIPEISIQEFCQTNYDIMLCGHTHGGQIFPIHILSYLFNACFVGMYSINNKHIYVSSGTSTATIPMRILSDSMIAVININ